MSVSHVEGSTAPANKGKNTDRLRDQEGTKPEGQETPFWEQVAGFIGLLLVLAVVGFLVYEGIQPRTEAELMAEVKSITEQPGGYLVEFELSNHGRTTAAAVIVEGALYDTVPSGEPLEQPLETAEMNFDYVPDRSDRTGSFVFEHDPRQYELHLQVKGFMDP